MRSAIIIDREGAKGTRPAKIGVPPRLLMDHSRVSRKEQSCMRKKLRVTVHNRETSIVHRVTDTSVGGVTYDARKSKERPLRT